MFEVYFILGLAGMFILEEHPWILWLVVIGFIALVIWGITCGTSSGGGYYTTSSSSYSPTYEVPEKTETTSYLYRGTMTSGSILATYRDGMIFKGYNTGLHMSFIDGTHKNDLVYKGTGTTWLDTPLGRVENGYIYRGNGTFYSDIIGRYQNGYIYRGNSERYSDIIGSYKGDGEGAAAAAVMYLRDELED